MSRDRSLYQPLFCFPGLGTESSFNKTYGVTYNCRREGGDRITITGHNFGVSGARVTINGKPCTSLTHDVAERVVSCTAPAGVWLPGDSHSALNPSAPRAVTCSVKPVASVKGSSGGQPPATTSLLEQFCAVHM